MEKLHDSVSYLQQNAEVPTRVKKIGKKAIISLFLVSCNVCPMTITETCAQTKGFDFWRNSSNVVWRS